MSTQARPIVETAERADEGDDRPAIRTRRAAQRGICAATDTARAAVAGRAHDLHAP